MVTKKQKLARKAARKAFLERHAIQSLYELKQVYFNSYPIGYYKATQKAICAVKRATGNMRQLEQDEVRGYKVVTLFRRDGVTELAFDGRTFRGLRA